jgi:cytosine/adenosine deaminase-related metal-dependent hydrolase
VQNLLEMMLRAGSTHIRTHVDVCPEAGLAYLDGVHQALAAFEGKLTHEVVAFPQGEAVEMAQLLAEAGITIITHVPINVEMPPVPLLRDQGVTVAVGSDNIFDSWQPYGTGDMLERAGRLAERLKWSHEAALAQTLGFITGGKTPLDRQGQRVWPAVGDEANLVLVHASCSAEAVARRAKRQAVMFRGNLVAGTLE